MAKNNDEIFEDVMIALQTAEELGGPEGAQYVSLMERIAHETQRRANRVRQGADLRHLPARTVRLRITDRIGNERWLAYGNGRWYLTSKSCTPLSFAYLGISREAEFGFRIQDAATADELLAIVREYTDHTVEVDIAGSHVASSERAVLRIEVDVADWTKEEIDALAHEMLVQCEDSDDHPNAKGSRMAVLS